MTRGPVPRSASIATLPIRRGPRIPDGLEVDEAESFDPLVAELVAVAEELIAAADGEHDGAVPGRAGNRVALGRDHVCGHDLLVAVLAAADVDEVVRGGVETFAGPGAPVLEADAAPLAAPFEEEDVATVGVDVHLLGVEREQPQAAVRVRTHRAASSTTTVEPT